MSVCVMVALFHLGLKYFFFFQLLTITTSWLNFFFFFFLWIYFRIIQKVKPATIGAKAERLEIYFIIGLFSQSESGSPDRWALAINGKTLFFFFFMGETLLGKPYFIFSYGYNFCVGFVRDFQFRLQWLFFFTDQIEITFGGDIRNRPRDFFVVG